MNEEYRDENRIPEIPRIAFIFATLAFVSFCSSLGTVITLRFL